MSDQSNQCKSFHSRPTVVCPLSAPGEQRAFHSPCFTAGTFIKTCEGEKRVEDIRVGDRVLTRDNGYQKVVWAASRKLTANELAAAPHLTPILIRQGALGRDLPMQDMQVSPQHRMLLCNPQIREWFQSDEVLICAEHLTCYPGIERSTVTQVHYVHFMFDQHEIVLADGCWSESFQPRDMSSAAMDASHRREILEIFPELAEDGATYAAARATVTAEQADILSGLLTQRL